MSQFSLNLGAESILPKKHIWSVSELTGRIRDLLEGEFPDIWVEGEVSNFRPAQSGHLYFTLKDSKAQIRCVCFRDQVRGLRFKPEDGLHVTVRGSISVYDLRGEYQIYVAHIEPVGLGALQLAFEQLKKRLEAEGLFDESRKKPLPVLPGRIGVITSPAGAAVRDIVRVLMRRFPNVQVQIFPVKVQGDGAAAEIVDALRYFNRLKSVDVLILARGGGSLEDLWAFNEEILARAIAASTLPLISGVGHETDFTIADFVADVRAATPSAAAEIVVRTRQEFERNIAEQQRHIVNRIHYLFLEWRHQVRDLEAHRAFRQVEIRIRRYRQQVDDCTSFLAENLRHRFQSARQRVTAARSRLEAFDLRGRAAALRAHIERRSGELAAWLERIFVQKRRRFTASHLRLASVDLRARVARFRRRVEQRSGELETRMDRLLLGRRRRWEAADLRLRERSPYELLKRGYAIAYDASGKVLRSADQVSTGDPVSVRLARGEFSATVREKKLLPE